MKISGRIKAVFSLIACLYIGAVFNGTYAQTYTPVAVTGFNQDIIAESGTDATTVTSTVIDATDHVMYSAAFAATNALGGGILNSGTIVYSNYSWQLAPFTANNGLYLSNGGAVANTVASGVLTLASPASYTNLSLLLFSTEGNNFVTVQLNFTDGSVYNAGTGLVYDWYSNPGAVYSSFGRIVRVSASPVSDGVPQGNGRFYKMDVAVPCANQTSQLQSITLSFSSGTLSGRILVMALAGVGYTPLVVTPTITDATCKNPNGSIALSVSGSSSYYSYTWNTNPAQFSSTATNLAANDYTCIISDNNNCKTTYKGTVGTVPLAVVTATASPASICPGGSTTLSASATGPAVTGYTWSPGTQTGSTATVSPTATTTYTVSGQDANGCAVSATTDVTVKTIPTASFTASPDSVCEGGSSTITFTGTAGSGAVYDWNYFAGAIVQSGNGAGPYTLGFNTPGTYNIQLMVSDQGCASTWFSHPVVVSEKPTASFDINKSPICSGDVVSVTFTGTKPGNSQATWNWGGGFAKKGTGFGPYSVQYFSSGILNLTVKNGACTVTAVSKAVTVIPNPVADFTAVPPGGCVPVSVGFINQSQNADSYQWTFGDGHSATGANAGNTYTSTGNYTVKLVVSNQGMCWDSITKVDVINVSTPPVVAFSAVPDTGTAVEVHLASFVFSNESQYAGSYLWKFGDGDSSTQANPTHKYTAPGYYRVTLYATNGACMDSVSHEYYKVIPDKVLQIPNAFSPNGDGINDRWDIDGLKQSPGCTVTVFNRWGQEVFRSQGYQSPWDGNYKGKPVPLATYYYIITLPGKTTYNGWVVVLK